MEKQRGKFSGTTVFSNIVKRQETTIEEEAERLGLSEEQFEKLCIQALGTNNWEKLKRFLKKPKKKEPSRIAPRRAT